MVKNESLAKDNIRVKFKMEKKITVQNSTKNIKFMGIITIKYVRPLQRKL